MLAVIGGLLNQHSKPPEKANASTTASAEQNKRPAAVPVRAADIQLIQTADRNVKWNHQSATHADVDCDGKPDALILGSEKDTVVFGIKATTQNEAEILKFPIRADTQDGMCVAPKKIEIQPITCEWDDGKLPGCKVVRGCKSVILRDDDCDLFYFYWDRTQSQLVWARH